MNNKQCLHTHTTYGDGRDKPEDMLRTAIERGFDAIGFSEHSYNKHSRSSFIMTLEKTQEYVREIRALKEKYRGVIDVFCGLEYEFLSDHATDAFDYLIGSVHYLDCNGTPRSFDGGLESTVEYVKEYFGGDGMAFAKCYFETLATLPARGRFDIIGHFDLVSKNNDKAGFFDPHAKEYLQAGYAAIHALRGKIPLFEVNTGAIARGYKQIPYPQPEFLRELHACGFGAVITSDCHDRTYLDCAFDDARALLASVGYTSRFILTDQGFEEVAL